MPENQDAPRKPTTETLTLTLSKAKPRLHGTAQWTALMRNFSQSQQETCKNVITDKTQFERSMKMFTSGSRYVGAWNQLGISGEGTYSFPRPEVVYKGGFHDGEFHGDGELQYVNGSVMKGKWNKGSLVEKHLMFADGLEYSEKKWAYCRPFDRRFTIEHNEGLKPAGRSYMTAEQPTIQIPPNHYDVGTGFYNPVTKLIYKYEDHTNIAKAAKDNEQKWIEANCRVNPDLSKGPCPFLYENWLIPELDKPLEPWPRTRYGPMDNYDARDEFEKALEQQNRYDSRAGLGLFYDSTKQQKKESSLHGSIAKPHRDFISFSKLLAASKTELRKQTDTGKWGMSGQSCSKKSSIFIPRVSMAARQSRSVSVSRWGFPELGTSPGANQSRSASVPRWGFNRNPFGRKSVIDFSPSTSQSEPKWSHPYSRKSVVDSSPSTSQSRAGSTFKWAPTFLKKHDTDPGIATCQSDALPVKATFSDTAIIDKNINSWRAIHKEYVNVTPTE